MPLVVAIALWSATASIADEARSHDVQVNTFTTNNQNHPAVAWGADGQFVVVWSSRGSSSGSLASIQAQRYAENGSPIGGQFQVNNYLAYSTSPAVAMAPAGEFVVAWASSVYPSPSNVEARRFSSDGSPVEGQFQVNTDVAGFQYRVSVAMGSAGEFVIAWQSWYFISYRYQVIEANGQLYAADGTPVGGEFEVAPSGEYSSPGSPSVAMGPSGHFLVVWSARPKDTPDSRLQILAQIYTSDGSPSGGVFQVNHATSYDFRQLGPSAAANAAGDFIVAWQGETDMGLDHDIHARRLAADGTPLSDQFRVNTYTPDSQGAASVASDGDGNFIVGWQSSVSSGTDTSDESVQARAFTSDGSPSTDEFQVNTYTTGNQQWPAAAMGPAGGYVIVWASEGSHGTDTSSLSIQKTSGSALIFADGFESGNTGAWDQEVTPASGISAGATKVPD